MAKQFEYCSAAEAYAARVEFEKHEKSKIALRETSKFLEFKGANKDQLHWNFHYGQMKVMQSQKRFIAAIASRQCMRKGTMVLMWDCQYMPIEKVQPGMYVMAYNDAHEHLVPRKVTNWFESGKKHVWKVDAGGVRVTCTMNHKFLTQDGYMTLRDVIEGDRKVLLVDKSMEWRNVKAFYAGESETFDIEVEVSHNFIAKDTDSMNFGFIVHNSGKSEIGVPWLYEEMRARGPGNYMVVAPSYPILEASALPKFKRLFVDILHLGHIKAKPLTFILSEEGERHLWGHKQSSIEPTIVAFGHGANPDSLESRTSLACWIDEGGQDSFKGASFEAIEGRHSNTAGRILITSTPYSHNSLKTRFYDPWVESGRNHPDIDIIQWPSTANPNFPPEEFERLKSTMPDWRFKMFYCGEFSLPSGLIYDVAADPNKDVIVSPFNIPDEWPKYVGIDFGGINTLALFGALDPINLIVYIYKEYFPAQAYGIAVHANNVLRLAGGRVEAAFGGARSEGQWREEFRRAGLNIQEPAIADVNVGIARAYNLMSQGRLKIVKSDANTPKLSNEITSYRYESDPETGEVLPDLKIVEKSSFHAMDAMRYMSGGLGFLLAGLNLEIGAGGGRRYNEPTPEPSRRVQMVKPEKTIIHVGGSPSSAYRPAGYEAKIFPRISKFGRGF